MLRRNAYTWAGLGLLVAGGILFGSSLLIFHLTWLTAMGICMFIMSFILLALRQAVPDIPPEVCNLLLETGIGNMASLIEELGINTKAIYLPSSLSDKLPRAFIPLNSNGSDPRITRALPQRLITRYGNGPEDIGLLISTVGSTAAGMLESRPGATAGELESALTALFSGRLGIAGGTRVACSNDHIKVVINKPRFETDADLSHQCLGGPLATIAASPGSSLSGPRTNTMSDPRCGPITSGVNSPARSRNTTTSSKPSAIGCGSGPASMST